MKKFINIIVSTFVVIGLAGVFTVVAPETVSARTDCRERVLTFPTWYSGLVDKDSCEIKAPQSSGDKDGTKLSAFIWKIVLNIIDILMQLVGYASVIFLVIGGFRYITATGEPDKMTAAKKTVTNAIIGLILALASVAIVNVIAGLV